MNDTPRNSHTHEMPEIRRFAHDLRNSLSAILSYAQVLDISLSEQKMNKEADAARAICDAVMKMDLLITEQVEKFSDTKSANGVS